MERQTTYRIITRAEAMNKLSNDDYKIWVGNMKRQLGDDHFITFRPIESVTVKDLKSRPDTDLVFFAEEPIELDDLFADLVI